VETGCRKSSVDGDDDDDGIVIIIIIDFGDESILLRTDDVDE
jgi:hypothetical protein